MTLKLPKPSIADKFLRLIGKKRAVYFPHKKHVDYALIIWTKRKFF